MISLHPNSHGHFVHGYYIKQCFDLKEISKSITKQVWSNSIWAGCYREENTFVASFFCALDFDDGFTKKEAAELFKEHQFILGPTKSDGIVKVTPKGERLEAKDRFRLIVPWDKPIFDLDVFRYNMKILAEKFQSDPYATDGARCWQPCKSIEILKTEGKRLEVIQDIPQTETKAFKEKQFRSVINYFKKTKTLPGYVTNIINGNVSHGDINTNLFKAACCLFQVGKEYEQVIHLLENDVTLTHKHFYSTIKSAAKTCGVV